MTRAPSSSSSLRAFSLVEVTLALGIAGFCLVTLVGLLSVGMNSNRAALEQTGAAAVVQAVVADLRAAPPYSSTTNTKPLSPRYALAIPPPGAGQTTVQTINVRADGSLSSDNANGPGTSAAAADAAFKVCLQFIPPAGSSKAATMARVFVVWPPQASTTQQVVPTTYTGSLEALFALDTN